MTKTTQIKKRPRKKSSFYHARNKIGLNENAVAKLLDISVDEVESYDDYGAPALAERFMMLWDKKHVNYEGWQGFLFSRDVLCHGKKRWTPFMLFEYHKRESRLNAIENELKQVKTLQGALTNLYTVFVDKLKSKSRKTPSVLASIKLYNF